MGVPDGPRRLDAASVKAQSNPALGVVGKVFGVVEPPSPVVVPEMMVWVGADADSDFGGTHGACGSWHTRNPGNKKPPIPIRKRR